MSMQEASKDDWESQLTDYTFGVMDAESAARFEQGLLECREHVALAQQYSEVAAWLALAVPPAEPPGGHKTRLMSRIGSLPQAQAQDSAATASGSPAVALPTIPQAPVREQPKERVTDLGAYREKRRFPSFIPALAATAAALVLFIGLWTWQSTQQPDPFPPGTIAFAVEGQGQTTASAVAFVNPDSNQATLLANGLTPLPTDKVYELWLLPAATDAKPVPAGIINVGNNGQARHQVTAPSNLRDYVGVAVTIEDAPGVQEPTDDPILVGTYDTQ